MSNIRWIVQNNFRTDAKDFVIMKEACEKLGLEFEGIKVIPFSDNIPEISKDSIPVFYGGTGWINKIYEKHPALPGIFFNPESTFPYWVEKYGDAALNYGAKETTFHKLSEIKCDDFKQVFIRPISDLKEFNGGVMTFGQIKEWRKKIFTDCPDLGNLPIIIGETYGLSKEWRLFIIDGKVCTGSQYRTYYVLNTRPEVPKDVIDFAERQAKVYSPAPVFVMDIGQSDKNLYVIEIGCFNSAGFYESNVEKIIREVSKYLENNNDC